MPKHAGKGTGDYFIISDGLIGLAKCSDEVKVHF